MTAVQLNQPQSTNPLQQNDYRSVALREGPQLGLVCITNSIDYFSLSTSLDTVS